MTVHYALDVGQRRVLPMFAVERGGQFGENPRLTLRGSADHDGVCARVRQYPSGFFGAVDVAVGNDRNPRGLLDLPNSVVFGLALEFASAGAAMDRQGLNAAVFGDTGDFGRVTVFTVPAGPDFQRYRNVDGGDDSGQNVFHQLLVFQQGRTCGGGTDLLGRAAHVDVNDVGAALLIQFGRFRHFHRIVTQDLHGSEAGFAGVIGFLQCSGVLLQFGIGDYHFRYRQSRAESAAKLPKRLIGDAGHRRQQQIVGQGIRAYAHNLGRLRKAENDTRKPRPTRCFVGSNRRAQRGCRRQAFAIGPRWARFRVFSLTRFDACDILERQNFTATRG